MAKFGLACEGITDQIVIEHILCGYYKDYPDLEQEISPLEPARDETDRKQEEGTGGWTRLLAYLKEDRFRDNVLNNEYIIIQIDTDISDEKGFDTFKYGLTPEELISKVINRLIKAINNTINTLILFKWDPLPKNLTMYDFQYQFDVLNGFYEKNKAKISFAISVHSLECWILPMFKESKNEKITGCVKALERASKTIKVKKNYKTYEKLTKSFTKNKILMSISSKNISFDIFIKSLPVVIS